MKQRFRIIKIPMTKLPMKTKFNCLLLIIISACFLTSCKKDYSCVCHIDYDNGTSDTTTWLMKDWSSKDKAEKDCTADNGSFEYNDVVTGILVTGTKTCKLE